MQSDTYTESPDEVDEETLQTLLLYLGCGKPPVSEAGSTAPDVTVASAKSNGGATTTATSSSADPLNACGGVQLSGSNTVPNTAQGSQRHSAVGTAAGTASYGTADAGETDIPVYALPDAQYVERTILPLLLRGLEEVALARPPDPLAFLGAYLISNNPQKPTASSVVVLPGVSSGGTEAPTQQEQQRQRSSFLPSDQPALAEAVQRAVERFSPYSMDAPA